MFNDRVLKPTVKEINSKSFFTVDMGFMKKQGTKSVESILMYVRRDS
jgi:plasmid replication initiation protein